VTYVEQIPPNRNGLAPDTVQFHETFVAHRRRPRRTHSPYPSNWRDRIALALLLGAAFLALVLLIVGFLVAVTAIGALIHVLRGSTL